MARITPGVVVAWPRSHPRATATVTAVVVIAALVGIASCTFSRDSSMPPLNPLATAPPTGAAPVPTPAPTRKPAPKPTPVPTPTPKPTVKPAKTQPAKPPTGSGPFGSMRVTGTAGVALTFDDGPDPTRTPILLDMLKQQRVKATFCVLGTRATAYPALIRRMVAEGHTLCNHSWRHLSDLGTRPESFIRTDLQATINAIRKAAPNAKVKYFRAPYGSFNAQLVRIAANMGMRPLYWSVDPKDWDTATYGQGSSMVSHIISAVEHATRPGGIVLSHDIKPDTVTAYRTLLPWLKQRFKLIALPV